MIILTVDCKFVLDGGFCSDIEASCLSPGLVLAGPSEACEGLNGGKAESRFGESPSGEGGDFIGL